MKATDSYSVCVVCTTYNQAQFIEDTLNGFCKQKTDVPFICVVLDDASTDGEQEVLTKYFQNNFNLDDNNVFTQEETSDYYLSFAQHNTNRNCYFAVFYLKYNHFLKKDKDIYYSRWKDCTKYIALCEGDDYWIDPFKLQKQYDFMESHPDISLCHHDYRIRIGDEITDRKAKVPQTQDLLSIAANNSVATLTMFYRNYSEPLLPKDFKFKYPVYQFFWNLRLAEKGNIFYINEPMAVYRVSTSGIYSKQSIERQFVMSEGNISNMIKWYKHGYYRPDVVKVLKARSRGVALSFIKKAVKQGKILTSIMMIFRYIKIIYF